MQIRRIIGLIESSSTAGEAKKGMLVLRCGFARAFLVVSRMKEGDGAAVRTMSRIARRLNVIVKRRDRWKTLATRSMVLWSLLLVGSGLQLGP